MIKLPSENTLWKMAAAGLGLITGTALIAFMNQLNFLFYPFPESFDGNEQQYSLMLLDDPVFLTGKIISTITGSFFAGAVPKLVYQSISIYEIMLMGMILALVGFIDLMAAPYPVWFWIATNVIYIPFAVIGYLSVRNIREQKRSNFATENSGKTKS